MNCVNCNTISAFILTRVISFLGQAVCENYDGPSKVKGKVLDCELLILILSFMKKSI